MAKTVLLDAGPLIAILDKRDTHHLWAQEHLSKLTGRLVTCESVLSEVIFITKTNVRATEAIRGMLNEDILSIESSLEENQNVIFNRLLKYWDTHASLADMHLLNLYDNKENAVIFTLDSDFLIYKDSKGKQLNLISPY